MWGQGSQRSRLSGLRVGPGRLFHGLRPDGSIRQPPGATASEPATPTASGSCLPSSPHLPHPLGPAPALPDRDCQPLGSCPLGLALGGQGGRVGVGAPPRPTPPARLTSPLRLPPGAHPLEGGGSPRRACTAPAPRTARKREESRAFHGYNKSKGEVGAGEIRNFPTPGTGTCQAAAPGTPRLSLLLPASLAGSLDGVPSPPGLARYPTCPEGPWEPWRPSLSQRWASVSSKWAWGNSTRLLFLWVGKGLDCPA